MPRISSFYGIVIFMYYDEQIHPGRPHFHARYGSHEASFDIDQLSVIEGRLPGRALRLVAEWAARHRAELLEDWELARNHLPLKTIDPLD